MPLLLNTGKILAVMFQLRSQSGHHPVNSPPELNTTFTATFLGLIVDKALIWNTHIRELSKRLSHAYFVILTLSWVLKKELIMVYYAYVYLLMNYGVIFWGNSLNGNKIFITQKWIIRIIDGLKYRNSCRDSF